MSPDTKVGSGFLSEQELAELDLGHMKGLAEALSPNLAKLLLSDPFEQQQIVIKAAETAKVQYHELKFENNVKKVDLILEAYNNGQLALPVLLEKLGLTESEKKNNGGLFGFLRRH